MEKKSKLFLLVRKLLVLNAKKDKGMAQRSWLGHHWVNSGFFGIVNKTYWIKCCVYKLLHVRLVMLAAGGPSLEVNNMKSVSNTPGPFKMILFARV
jgi:hypothetical protein